VAGQAPLERRVDVRVRRPRRLLAAAPLFTGLDLPVTVYGVATALQRSPEQVKAMLDAGWEIASHGLKWIDYRDHDIEHERRDLHDAIRVHTEVTGSRPTGWYCGRTSVNTVDLASEEGGFTYVSDTYDDDLPYYREHFGAPQLIIPYSLATNDMRFTTASGFANGEEYFQMLKDSFDVLYEEGEAGSAKMMSIGLHCRLVGMPGRFAGLRRFVDYIRSKERVWIAKRIDIAEHWLRAHPYQKPEIVPSQLAYDDFASSSAASSSIPSGSPSAPSGARWARRTTRRRACTP
jgi:peptidoglycan/xylan/chitin deacetylase (PgdA/CDA1 family)